MCTEDPIHGASTKKDMDSYVECEINKRLERMEEQLSRLAQTMERNTMDL